MNLVWDMLSSRCLLDTQVGIYESEVRNRSHLKIRSKMVFKAMRLNCIIGMEL